MVLGFVLLPAGLGGFLLYRGSAVPDGWAEALGTVVALEETPGVKGRPVYCPAVAFTDGAGVARRFVEERCTEPAAYAVGETVRVAYDPAGSKSAQLHGERGSLRNARILLGVAAVMLAAGIVWLGIVRRQGKPPGLGGTPKASL